jgi:hypothetical protein
MSVEKRTDKREGPEPAKPKRPYTAPRLIEYGSVAKLTQGTRSVQQDSPGATTFRKDACL